METKEFISPKQGFMINYKGTINLDKLYKNAKPWFDDRNYDFTEKEHTEKNKSYGNELTVKWVAEREVTGYFKFFIETSIIGKEINSLNGNYDGNFRIRVYTYLLIDHKNEFKKPFLFNIFNKTLMKPKIENYWGKLKEEQDEYISLLKELIGFKI
ncbi:hypothetical protein K8R47_02760 [archaeon]|nr:hypothetical protein [archaeon]